MTDTPHDLSDSSDFEVEIYLGKLVRSSLAEQGGCVLLVQGDLVASLPVRAILSHVNPEAIAAALLAAGWGDEAILGALESLQQEQPA